ILPMSEKAMSGDTAFIRDALNRGEGVDNRVSVRGGQDSTLLMLASQTGADEMVRLLLDRGAKVRAENDDGDCALSFAAATGHASTVRILLAHGADPNAKNAWQGPPPVRAVESGH